jgi:hypothetical protein
MGYDTSGNLEQKWMRQEYDFCFERIRFAMRPEQEFRTEQFCQWDAARIGNCIGPVWQFGYEQNCKLERK